MKSLKSRYLIIFLGLSIALFYVVFQHVYTEGSRATFVRAYLIDILLPILVYMLFQVLVRRHYNKRNSRVIGSTATFFFALLAENLQFAGVNFLGDTWDPMDIVCYIGGIVIGVLLDVLVIDRWERQTDRSEA